MSQPVLGLGTRTSCVKSVLVTTSEGPPKKILDKLDNVTPRH